MVGFFLGADIAGQYYFNDDNTDCTHAEFSTIILVIILLSWELLQ